MKKIIICCDGTWNKPGNTDRNKPVKTNVQKMYEAVATNETLPCKQVKFYGQGVGTGFNFLDKLIGGATGSGIDSNIKNAYKFIMWNYEPGDEIYFFGFSRGAYTARSLVGWIRNCGIMRPDCLHLVDEGFRLYRDRSQLTHPDSNLMLSFKQNYCYEPETKIKFIGVWDTVGALGIPIPWLRWLNRKHEFHDVTLSSTVDYAYQALAADEKRIFFTPTLWELSETVRSGKDKQVMEQVWFPGVHSNIGGGYENAGLSDGTFLWMKNKAEETGLQFNEGYIKRRINADSTLKMRNSAAEGIYQILPNKKRKINTGGKKMFIDDINDINEEYEVKRNESIHYTCFERHHKVAAYRPQNIYTAISKPTAFYPAVEEWSDDWKPYLEGVPKKFSLLQWLGFGT